MSSSYNDVLITTLRGATRGQSLDAAKNAVLYERIKAGDIAAREEIILGNMPFVLSKVEAFIRCFQGVAYLRDDLVSAGCIGLVNAVKKLESGPRPRKTDETSVTGFIGMWINRELSELIEIETPIHLPRTSKYRARAQGQSINAPVVYNDIPERFETPAYEKELEVRDLIASCIACPEERVFMAMREARYTYTEIAEAIHWPVTSMYMLAHNLYARLQRKLRAVEHGLF